MGARTMGWIGIMATVTAALLAAACSEARAKRGDTAGQAGEPAPNLPAVTFATSTGATVRLHVEVADDVDEMGCGLMHRTELPLDQGMIFILAEDSAVGFWMRNTLIPLSIAYVAADGRIVDIQDMEPVQAAGQTPYRLPDGRVVGIADGQPLPPLTFAVTYPPSDVYRIAIEVNKGWFAERGIAIGDLVDLSAIQGGSLGEPAPICRERGL